MQYARPVSDVENPGGWATAPLCEKLDEEPFDDLDFIESPKSASGKSFTLGLSAVPDPGIHTDHIVRIRAKTGVSGTFKYELLEGTTIIKDSGDIVLGTVEAEYNMMLTEEEAGSISDYGVLRLQGTAVATQKNQRQSVSWIRVDVPDVPANEFVCGGDVPISILPDAPKAFLSKSYSGDIPLSVQPGYSSALDRVYGGDIPLVTLPDFPKAILEKSYGGDIGIVLLPNSICSLSEPGAGEFVYAGDIPLMVIPSYISSMDRAYQGAVALNILPDFAKAPLEKSYTGNLSLLVVSDFPKATLEKAYNGDAILALTPSSLYSLEEALLEFAYAGNIPLSVLSGHSLILDRIYKGNINLAPNSSSVYSLEGPGGGVPANPNLHAAGRERGESQLLQRYKMQRGYTDAQLATDMTRFGWGWTESYVAAILAGSANLREEEREFIRRYLLTRYCGETLA